MAFDVKITKFKRLGEIICPHYCMSCGKIGGIFCDICKNYNISEHMNCCLKCGVVIENGCCEVCELPYDGSWCLGAKDGILGEMVTNFKYNSVRALAWPLAEMLATVLPCLEGEVRVVPLPTLSRHVRERGFDHAKLVAGCLAKVRSWMLVDLVERITKTVQVGASADARQKQASVAYALSGEIEENVSYLVIDDIYTTGASIKAVCELLKNAGAKKIFVGLIARS